MVAIEGSRALWYHKVGLREDFNTGENWVDLYIEDKELVKKEKLEVRVLFLYLLQHNILPPNLVALNNNCISGFYKSGIEAGLTGVIFPFQEVSSEITQLYLAGMVLCLGGDA